MMLKQKVRIEYLTDSMKKNMKRETVLLDQVVGEDVD